MAKKLKIILAISEVDGFIKTGGLADIGHSLPQALKQMGHDVRIVMPFYKTIKNRNTIFNVVPQLGVPMGFGEMWCSVHESFIDEVPIYFVEHNQFFHRDGIYDDGYNAYHDNAERFGMFSKAVLQLCMALDFQPDVIHCNDWHTSLLPYYLKTHVGHLPFFEKTASILSLHNAAFHGNYSAESNHFLGIAPEHFNMHGFEDYGRLNFLKGGIAWADKINTVSPGYANELLTYLGGHGLHDILWSRRDDFMGILNGCDYDSWNPAADSLIPAKFSTRSMKGKAKCKSELQHALQLRQSEEVPVLGIISRLTSQKGFDYLIPALYSILQWDVQVVILGSGDPRFEHGFNELAWRFPNKVGWRNMYDNTLSHWIEAGSDFFLMPSLFEPCGLNQLYSLRYGTLPIVRAVGGLKDTVRDHSTGKGTGFVFESASTEGVIDIVGRAVHLFYNEKKQMKNLIRNAMKENFNWDKSAKEYVHLYDGAIKKKAG